MKDNIEGFDKFRSQEAHGANSALKVCTRSNKLFPWAVAFQASSEIKKLVGTRAHFCTISAEIVQNLQFCKFLQKSA